jgi:hypothetical protein
MAALNFPVGQLEHDGSMLVSLLAVALLNVPFGHALDLHAVCPATFWY